MKKLSDFLPPGADPKTELGKSAAFASVFLLFWSMTFLVAFSSAYDDLFTYIGREKILLEGAVMERFSKLMEGRFAGFWPFLLCLAVTALFHYLSFTRSHSIYVMKRLESPLEFYRRVFAFPLLTLAAGVLLILLLTGIYALIYRFVTPEAAYRGLTLDFWEMFL